MLVEMLLVDCYWCWLLHFVGVVVWESFFCSALCLSSDCNVYWVVVIVAYVVVMVVVQNEVRCSFCPAVVYSYVVNSGPSGNSL